MIALLAPKVRSVTVGRLRCLDALEPSRESPCYGFTTKRAGTLIRRSEDCHGQARSQSKCCCHNDILIRYCTIVA
jgi:hypothetical protein